jgi:hypothetical protein
MLIIVILLLDFIVTCWNHRFSGCGSSSMTQFCHSVVVVVVVVDDLSLFTDFLYKPGERVRLKMNDILQQDDSLYCSKIRSSRNQSAYYAYAAYVS